MLSNLGIQLAVDAYGPISDNAGGIAEMSELPKEVRSRTDKLDAVGNTTAAIGKGFAIASAALTALALFGAFMTTAHVKTIDVSKANVMAGLFIGGMLPFVFSALAMGAVGRAAMKMIEEVRRQFKDIPALKAALEAMKRNDHKEMKDWSAEDLKIFQEADGKAEYGKCVEISTQAALKQMIVPGLMAVVVPVVIAFLPGFGVEALGGMLAGVTVTGVLMAIFQANAGGAWDNAKKSFEEGVNINGQMYTGMGKKPVNSIVRQSSTGAATNIIAGLGVGMMSTMWPVIIIAFSIIGAFYFGGLYGIAIAAVGMLSNLGIQLAVDAYGPISDNAGGIAEMSELPKEVRSRTDKLDAVGNTTAAIGKGFAIASAALTALALFGAFMTTAHVKTIDVSKANVMAGLFIGGMLPFVFSALAMGAVGRAAMKMIEEVRRQFKDIPALKAALEAMKRNDHKEMKDWSAEDLKIFQEADGKAEYGKCVEISTQAALKQMIVPGLMAVVVPVVIAFLPGFGVEALGGMLAGVTVTGVLMAIFQANAGGAWDNAKKSFEEGVNINGQMYYKKSEPHKAAVVGDTVGDPFKDTSGPSLNILLKLMSVVALVIAPLLVPASETATSHAEPAKVKMTEVPVATTQPATSTPIK